MSVQDHPGVHKATSSSLATFPDGIKCDLVARGWPAEQAPSGTTMKRLNPQRECFDTKRDIGVFAGTTAGGTVRKKDDHKVPPELAAKGVTQDAWEKYVFEDLPEALSNLNHCCWEVWCCIFTCGIWSCCCTGNRQQFHEAGLEWQANFNEYLETKGCYARVLSYAYQQTTVNGGTGQASSGNCTVHGLVVAYTPEMVEVLKRRPQALGYHAERYSKPTDFILFIS
eukprot:m.169630 g.169630  ORF g.169630 m.169630 type:complete len:226 (+) comp13127_c0_seq1:34-711(+)